VREHEALCCGLLWLLLAMTMPLSAMAEHNVGIAVIHSYQQDYPWTRAQHEAFTRTLQRELPDHKLAFVTEYLDTKQVLPTEEYRESFLHYLRTKHEGHAPDLVYVTDDNALRFLLAAKDTLHWQAPIVFSGINNLTLLDSLERQRVTGVFERKEIEPSIQLIRSLNPDEQRIIYLGDGGPTDQAIAHRVEQVAQRYPDLQIEHFGGQSLSNLLAQMNTAGPGSVVLTTVGGLRDDDGYVLRLDQSIRQIVASGRAVFVMEDGYLQPGVVGGYVTSGKRQGETAAELVRQILLGTEVAQLAPHTESPNEFVLDWKALQQHDIKPNQALLTRATLLNKPLPFAEKHATPIRWTLGGFSLIALLVIASFSQSSRRKDRLIAEQTTDELTGLPNRTKLLQDIKAQHNPQLAIIDINNFKAINTFYGLETGDAVLVATTRRIQEKIDDNINAYRIGSDHFALLANQQMTLDSLKTLVMRIIEHIKQAHFSDDTPELHLTATAGISSHRSSSPIAGAEQALRQAKHTNEEVAVDNAVEADAERQRQNILWAHKLGIALKEGRVKPFFQPIINNRTGEIVKYEALARIIDEDGSIVTPYFFLEAAKQTRQYAMLTRTIIEHSLQALLGNDNIVSLNFTVEDIRNQNTVKFFKQQIQALEVAQRVVIELTESEGIENYQEVADFIDDIKTFGCRISIDDFGTGYSNFNHMIHLNADYLKIDGSIIKRINDDDNSELITSTLVDFAKRLGMETIAEFVDSQAALDKVTVLGVDCSQGFFLGKPLPTMQDS
jgi:diguanylate cyclase (GGDEF)-like protein